MKSKELRRAIRITALIEKLNKQLKKFEGYVSHCKSWIKKDKLALKATLKKLTKEENIEYGYHCGFIEKPDYMLMKLEANK